ncbi:MAG: translocation/assembly module TamB domain-containing protein [Vicinamibacterales bacterium]
MRVRKLRFLAILAASGLAVVAILLLVLHLPVVRSRIFDRAQRELESRFGLDLQAGSFSYNLLTLGVTLRDVRLGAESLPDQPFLEADLVEAHFPWSVVTGRFVISGITVANGHLTFVRDEEGRLNLPRREGPESPPRDTPFRLNLQGVDLRNLDFTYRDPEASLAITARGIRADLEYHLIRVFEGVSGAFGIDRGVTVQVGDRTLRAAPIDARLAFDGSDVSLQDVSLRTDEATLAINGRILHVFDSPAFDLSLDGTTDVGEAIRWAPDLPMAIDGTLPVSGSLTGPVSEFQLALDLDGGNLTVGDERGLSVRGPVRLTSDAVSSDRLTITTTTGGAITATLSQPFGDETSATYAAEWTSLDPRAIYRMAGAEPGPIGARLRGRAEVDLAPRATVTRATVHNEATAANGPGLVPIAGTLDARVDDGGWRASFDQRSGGTTVAGTVNGRFDAGSPLDSTLAGRTDVHTGDLRQLARLLASFGQPLPDIVAEATGPLDADATLGGRLADPEVTARVKGAGLAFPSIGDDVRIDARVSASRRLVNVPDLAVDIGHAHLTGGVRLDLASDDLSGTLKLDAPSAADLQSAVPDDYRLEGPVQATAILGGTPSAPAIDVTLNGSSLMLAGQPIDTLAVRAHVTGDAIDVGALEVSQADGGTLSGTARYAWDTGRYAADLTGSSLTWDGVVLEGETTHASVDLSFEGEGTLDEPRGDGTVDFTLTGGAMDQLVQQGSLQVRLEGDTAHVTGQVPQLGASVDATVGTAAPYAYDATATLDRMTLEPVATLGGIREGEVDGTLSLSAEAHGTIEAPDTLVVDARLQALDALVGGLPVALTSPATLAWRDGALDVGSLSLSVGDGQLTASGEVGGDGNRPLSARLEGDLGQFARMGRALGAPGGLDLDGHLAARWESPGGLADANAELHVTNGELSWVNVPPVRDLAVDATFDGAALRVTTLTGQWQNGGIEGTATIPRALLTDGDAGGSAQSGQARLRLTGLTEDALAPWVDDETRRRLTARVSATVDADIRGTSLEAVDARLVLDEAAFTLAGIEAVQPSPARITLRDGVVHLDQVGWQVADRPLALSGTVDLRADDSPALDVAATGTADLRVLTPFLPDVTMGGTADLDVRVGGTVADPAVNGDVALDAVQLGLRTPRFLVSDLSGPISLDGRRIGFNGIAGSANGGRIRLDGAFTLDGMVPSGGQLITELRSVALEYPDGFRSESDGLLTLAPEDNGGWLLTGDVRVQRASYRENLSLAALATGNRARTTTVGERSALEDFRLNIFVVTVDDILVDNNYGRLQANAALRVVGTAADPALTGRVTLEEGGQVYLAGNTLQVERGTISFTDPTRIQPDLDLQLQTRASGQQITLSLSGTPDQLSVDVANQTDPQMSNEEVYQTLLGTSGGITGGEAATILSAELLGTTGRAVGLDTLRVERGFNEADVRSDPGQLATETDPSTRLTLSKRLRPNVELTLSQSLRDSGDLAAILAYRPTSNIELRAITLGDGDRLVDIRHELTFGGGSRPDRSERLEPEIASIAITGNPGEPEAPLRNLLDLETGDRFDFYQWQEDLDALRQHFWDQSYYEARVTGSREEDEAAGTVALEYDIERGPRTELEITGYDAPADLRRALLDAWTHSIFDQFLLSEFETRVARRLVRDGVIGSEVSAGVATASADRKVIRIDVTRGTTVGHRELRFTGNAAVEASRLETAVQRAGLGPEAWLEPSTIADAAEAFYRRTGYLNAEVASAGPPTVEQGIGVLPFTVTEGPRFTIGEIALDGVDDGREGAVRDAIGIHAGDTYDAAGIEAGSDRIVRLYRDRGFNEVRVDAESQVDADTASVRVDYAVQEGPQQILREITTSGASKTREGVIEDALRLKVGEPVDMGEWALARKRLYDTNVFRQVDIEAQPLTPDENTPAGTQPVRAVVTVQEYPTWRVRYGVQLNDERLEDAEDMSTRTQSLGLTGELQNQNLFGRAISAGLTGRYERDRWTARTFVQTPTFFALPATTSYYTQAERENLRVDDVVQFVTDRRTIAAEQRWRKWRGLELSYSYRFERSHTYDPNPEPDDPFPLDLTVDIARVSAAFLADRRDDPFNTRAGWFFSANWDQAAEALGSDYRNAKLVLQQYYFRPIGEVVLATRASFGGSFWADETLLPQERFYTGGATTIRGYGENAVGPRDFLGQAAGGKALLLFNQEVRFPIAWWFNGVGFVDAGNVFAENAELSLSDLKVGYGFGLRVDTPFALVRIDYGIPGSDLPFTGARRPNAWSSGRWYIGIGHIF